MTDPIPMPVPVPPPSPNTRPDLEIQRAICPGCLQETVLNDDGTFARHRLPAPRPLQWVDGFMVLGPWCVASGSGGATRHKLATLATLALLLSVVAAAILSSIPVPAASLRPVQSPASAAPSTHLEAASTPLAAALAGHPVTVTARPGDGWMTLTARVCGSSATWRAQQARNGGAAWLYLGRSYTIDCSVTAASAPIPTASWLYPLANSPCRSTSGAGAFGAPRNGYSHQGIDLARPTGTVVRAARAGTVTFAGWNGGAGQQVVINHGGGWVTKYNHLSYVNVHAGQWVAQGQHIGSVGSTGRSTGPHLHVELILNGRVQDPTGVLAPRC